MPSETHPPSCSENKPGAALGIRLHWQVGPGPCSTSSSPGRGRGPSWGTQGWVCGLGDPTLTLCFKQSLTERPQREVDWSSFPDCPGGGRPPRVPRTQRVLALRAPGPRKPWWWAPRTVGHLLNRPPGAPASEVVIYLPRGQGSRGPEGKPSIQERDAWRGSDGLPGAACFLL